MKRAAGVGAAAIAIAALAYDPGAPAADPKRAIGLILATIAGAASVAGRVPADRLDPGVSRPVVAFAAFVAWSGATLAYGVPAGARDLATWVAAAALAVALDRWPRARTRNLALRASALVGAGASIAAIAERIAGARGAFVHGGQGNANWLGLLLAVALPPTIALVAGRRDPAAGPTSRSTRGLAAVAVAIEVVGLAISHSRVAWIAAAVTSIPIAAHLAREARGRLGAAGVAAVGVAIVAALVLRATTVPAPDPRPGDPLHGEDVAVPIAWEGRLWIARSSIDAARAALPFGVGLGGFAHAYLDAQGARLAPIAPKIASRRFVNATTAHDDWIELAVDSGPIAPALLFGAIALAAVAAVRTGFAAGAASLGALAVCATGDSPIRQPAIALILAVVLPACGGARARILPRRAIDLVTTSASALLLAFAVAAYVADRRAEASRDQPPEDRLAALAAAARLDPTNGEIALDRGLVALDLGRLDLALAELARSRPLLANVGTDVAIGSAHALAGDPERAIEAYERAIRRNPASFRAHANLAAPLVTLGRLDEADRHLAVAAALWPGHPRLADLIDRVRRARLDREAR